MALHSLHPPAPYRRQQSMRILGLDPPLQVHALPPLLPHPPPLNTALLRSIPPNSFSLLNKLPRRRGPQHSARSRRQV